MQRIFNYGSFLQAYGLKSILEELGAEVSFVDYEPQATLIAPDGKKGFQRKIKKALEVFSYKAPFKEKIKFIKYKKNYAANYFPYLGIDDRMNYRPELDVLVIGSDEVFNCVQNNTNVGFTPELFGEGNKAKKLVSYAASFGNTTLEKLEKYNVKDRISGLLQNFDALSVRDSNSGEVVKALTGKEPLYNLDPVLMYDFCGKCKDIPDKVCDERYMIFYGYSGRFTKEECDTVRSYARENGLKVFCIGGVQNCCDRFIDCNPFEVLGYFKNAECVVTDTFHGTIMSVITHRKFVSFVRKSGYGNSEKLTDLLNRLKLNDRIINDMNTLSDMLSDSIDYSKTDEIIERERKNTYEYLKGVIYEG